MTRARHVEKAKGLREGRVKMHGDDPRRSGRIEPQRPECRFHITARNGSLKRPHINASPRLSHGCDKLRLDAGLGVIQQF